MNQERIKILELLEEGKIKSSEALDLLSAIENSNEEKQPTVKSTNKNPGRTLRVRVNGDKTKVNVNIPLSLLRIATKAAGMGMKWIPSEAQEQMKKKGIDLAEFDFEEITNLIDQGLSDGRLVDLETEDEEEGKLKVEVYVE